MKKTNIIETREFFKKAGYELLENEAKGVDYRYKCQDCHGYLYSRSLRSIKHQLKTNKSDNVMTFSTKNLYFYENMLYYMTNHVHNGTILLSKKEDIINIDMPLTFKCGECGREFHTSWHKFRNKNDKCCNFCYNRKVSCGEISNNHKDSNKFHLKAKEKGLIVLDGPQIRYHDKIVVQDLEGYRGEIIASSLMRGSNFEKFSVSNPFTIDNLRVYAFKHNWDCIIYNQEFKGTKSPIKMMCSCGRDFTVDTTHFIGGKFQCNECRVKQSNIAKLVEIYLIEKNLSYQKEKVFKDCKNKKPLPFDFYLTDYNACIEVDGIGHYRPVAFNGDKEKAEEIFIQRKNNDEIKNKYCKNNNIPLLRLPFWIIERKEYHDYINNFLSSLSRLTTLINNND